MKHKNRTDATSPAKAPSKPGKPRRTSSADNPAPTPAPRPKRALTGRGTGGPTKPPAPAHDPDAETRAYGDELARLASEDERAARWRSLIQGDRPATGGKDGARRADFARQAAEALGWPGWATYERTGRFDPLRGNLPLLYANAAVVTVTARPSMLGIILAALRKRAKPVADLDRIRAAAAEGSIPGEWHPLDYYGPVYEIPEPRSGTEYARLVAAREAQEAAVAQVLADAAVGRLATSNKDADAEKHGKAKRRGKNIPSEVKNVVLNWIDRERDGEVTGEGWRVAYDAFSTSPDCSAHIRQYVGSWPAFKRVAAAARKERARRAKSRRGQKK